jgi:hypothetical protein
MQFLCTFSIIIRGGKKLEESKKVKTIMSFDIDSINFLLLEALHFLNIFLKTVHVKSGKEGSRLTRAIRHLNLNKSFISIGRFHTKKNKTELFRTRKFRSCVQIEVS